MKPSRPTNVTPESFRKNRWGSLGQNQLPCSLILDGILTLKADALAVWMVLLHTHRNKMLSLKPDKRRNELFARIRIGHVKLMQYTGYSINTITKAIKSLTEIGFISHQPERKTLNRFKPRKRETGGSVTTEYYLNNPDVFEIGYGRLSFETKGQINIIPTSKIPYFTYPSCVVKETDQQWSLAKMSGSELRLYVVLLWMANRERKNDLSTTLSQLRKLSNLDPKTVIKALTGLEDRRLIQIWNGKSDSHAKSDAKSDL
jgi:hypothetical protein